MLRQGGAIAACPGSINTLLAQDLTAGEPAIMAEFVRDKPIGRFSQPDEIASGAPWRSDPRAELSGRARTLRRRRRGALK